MEWHTPRKAFGKSRLYGVVFTVIGVQIHLFDLGDERITGICARALVVESVLAHFIERGEKFFLRSLLPDRFANGGGLTDSVLMKYTERLLLPWP